MFFSSSLQSVASMSLSESQTASTFRCNGTSSNVGRLLPRSTPFSCCRIISRSFALEPFSGKFFFFLGGGISRSSELILNSRYFDIEIIMPCHCSITCERLLPNVKSGSFEGWFAGLWCSWCSVRNGKMSVCPVFVLHNWSQVMVHIINSQHGHL